MYISYAPDAVALHALHCALYVGFKYMCLVQSCQSHLSIEELFTGNPYTFLFLPMFILK